MRPRMRITAMARSLSSGAVGSSANITGGRLASARAMDTPRQWPEMPEVF